MPARKRTLVLDSWSIVAYFEDKRAGEQVAELIADAIEQGRPMQMTVANAAEVWYLIARRTSATEADTSIEELRQLGIDFADMDWELSRQAGLYKSKHSMSLADCYAAALAKRNSSPVIQSSSRWRRTSASTGYRLPATEEAPGQPAGTGARVIPPPRWSWSTGRNAAMRPLADRRRVCCAAASPTQSSVSGRVGSASPGAGRLR